MQKFFIKICLCFLFCVFLPADIFAVTDRLEKKESSIEKLLKSIFGIEDKIYIEKELKPKVLFKHNITDKNEKDSKSVIPLSDDVEIVPDSSLEEDAETDSDSITKQPITDKFFNSSEEELEMLNKKYPKITRADEDVLIYSVRLKKYTLTEGLIVYQDDEGEIWLPLSEFFRATNLPISVDAKTGKAKGWFFEKSREFVLDMEAGKLMSDSDNYELDDTAIERHEDDIYVTSGYLDKIMPFEVFNDFNSLSLIVNSPDPLPIEIQKAKENRRKKLAKTANLGKDNYDIYKLPNGYYSYPSVDLTLGSNLMINEGQKNTYSNYSIRSAGILAGFDTKFSLSGNSSTNNPTAYINARKYRPYEDSILLKDIEFGDIRSSELELLSSSKSGRGVYVSTDSDSRVNKGKTITISGYLKDGYEVELYRNGKLIDFLTEGKNNEYEFNSVAVETGLNIFKMLFIGPYGEKYEEEKKVYIPQNAMKKGEYSFSSSLTQDNKKVIETNNTGNSDNPKTNLKVLYGVTDNMTLSAGFSNQPDPVDDINNKSFGTLGLSTSIFGAGVGLTLGYGEDSETPAYMVDFYRKFFDWYLLAQYEDYNNINSEVSYLYSKFADSNAEVRLTGGIDIPYVGRFPVFIRAKQTTAYEGSEKQTATELFFRTSHNIKRVMFGYELTSFSDFAKNETTTAGLRVSTRYDIINIKGEYDYRISPEEEPLSISLKADFKVNEDINTFYEWETQFNDTDNINTVRWGISNRFKYGTVGANFSGNNNDTAIFSVSYSFGAVYNPFRNRYEIESKDSMSGSGSVAARVFLDNNDDGVYGRGDKPLKDIEVQTSARSKNRTTNERGEIFITEATPYNPNKISINEKSIKDISYHPTKEKVQYITKPGAFVRIDLPIKQFAEIEGEIYIREQGKLYPGKGLIVKVVDKDNKTLSKAIADYDGYFIIPEVPFGKHRIILDKEQITELGYKIPNSKKITIDGPLGIVEDRIIVNK